jgi:hypothetical protein
MAKVTAITNMNGDLIRYLRADPADIGGGLTIQSVYVPTPTERHHTVEIPDELLEKPAEEVHREIVRRLA